MTIFDMADISKINKTIIQQAKGYPAKGLYICGDVGVGKTFTSISIAKHCSKNNYLYMTTQDMLKRFRNCEYAKEEITEMDFLVKKRHLILDDLGTEKLTEWAYTIIFEFIDKRSIYNPEAIIITSNYSLIELYEKFDKRIASRIAGICKIIKITGEDRRLT